MISNTLAFKRGLAEFRDNLIAGLVEEYKNKAVRVEMLTECSPEEGSTEHGLLCEALGYVQTIKKFAIAVSLSKKTSKQDILEDLFPLKAEISGLLQKYDKENPDGSDSPDRMMLAGAEKAAVFATELAKKLIKRGGFVTVKEERKARGNEIREE